MLQPISIVHLISLVVALSALAAEPGAQLYVVGKGVKLLKEPKLTSAPASPRELGANTRVTWLGVAEKDPAFMHVESAGKQGYVLRTFLRLRPAQLEFIDGQRALEPKSFAASGATTTCPPPAQQAWRSPEARLAAAQLLYAEQINQAAATPEALDAKARSLAPPR